MRRSDLKTLVDLALLAAGILTFGSGLVLLFGFHMGQGPFRGSALGLHRLLWLNLHRLVALLVEAAVALHVVLNWKGLVGCLRRAFSQGHPSGPRVEVLLYATFGTVAATGLIAWIVLRGSAPFAGPVTLQPLSGLRHQLVDVHQVAGLLALALVVHHAAHRWRVLVHGVWSWARRVPAARSA